MENFEIFQKHFKVFSNFPENFGKKFGKFQKYAFVGGSGAKPR